MITFLPAPGPETARRARVVETPIGPLQVVASEDAVLAIAFDPFTEEVEVASPGDHAVLDDAVRQLGEYFAGTRDEFDLPLAPRGTEYQLRVWEALVAVPHASTATYSQIAGALGQPPGASRAVGLANGRNPIPVVVPCHRIIGADGSLTGYAGGLARKQTLLDLERAADDTLF